MIKFGPSGNSEAFALAGNSSTEQSAAWVKKMGLDCFEYSFGRGVRIKDETATAIGKAFADAGVEISVHAPYYVNLATPDEDKAKNSFFHIIESAKKCRLFGGKRIVFHPASQGKFTREEAVALTAARMRALRDEIYENGLSDMIFCPETMGKSAQIGTIEEITSFCKIDECFVPCVDFGHVNARENGSLKTEKDFSDRLSFMLSELGLEKMRKLHVHFSKIEYTAKGEVKHLTFEDNVYGPQFEPFSLAIKSAGLEPYIICESAGTQDVDALYMKRFYFDSL